MSLRSLSALVLLVLGGTAYTVAGYVESREPDRPAYDHLDLGAEFGPVLAGPGVADALGEPCDPLREACARRAEARCPRAAEEARPWSDPGAGTGS